MTTSSQPATTAKPCAPTSSTPSTKPQPAQPLPDHLGCRDLRDDRDPFGRG